MTWIMPLTVGPQLARQGWQCPVCQRVYSPDTAMCFACPPQTEVSTTTTWTVRPEDKPPEADR